MKEMYKMFYSKGMLLYAISGIVQCDNIFIIVQGDIHIISEYHLNYYIKRLVVIHVIDEEIELILADLKFYSKQLSKYLRKQKSLNSHYDFYLDDLVGYVDGIDETLSTLRAFILDLEIQLLKLKECDY